MIIEKKTNLKKLEDLCGGPFTIGYLLKVDKLALKMNQDTFAKKLGISKQHLSDIENNRVFPSMKLIKKIAHLVGDSPECWKIALESQLKRERNKQKQIQVSMPISQYLTILSKTKSS